MKMRVSAVQYHLHTIDSFDEFAKQCEHYIKTAMEFEAEFILFPEFFTTQLLSIGDEKTGEALQITDLPLFTERYERLFSGFAKQYDVHIIGGTHVTEWKGGIQNTAYLFYPDGSYQMQSKLHITPAEVEGWNMQQGETFRIFETEKGTIAILTCYDIEFPEVVRMAKAKGADVIFCPSCTDDRHGFHRVRYTSHARAVENQIYVVGASTVGSLPTVDLMRSNVGQAVVISPNDIPFPPGGIVAEGIMNDDMIITADLDLALLYEVRKKGSVTTWRDRRTDLYPDWWENE
ncbi:carbon-nitrogen hydrolase family protein [Domibacillus robiginosus]|uniref:carbon-nitrogen hydrolase family protein n=1 Tax=Domibacillus robiginosus TaxID=1071054 RepID=UPI00067E05C6|nr:carbon-nitrogen hydrolase family protein [Domibacillus robiginosus]